MNYSSRWVDRPVVAWLMLAGLIVLLSVGYNSSIEHAQAQAENEPDDGQRRQTFLCIEGLSGGSTHPEFRDCFETRVVQFGSERDRVKSATIRGSGRTAWIVAGIAPQDAGPIIEAHSRGTQHRAFVGIVDVDGQTRTPFEPIHVTPGKWCYTIETGFVPWERCPWFTLPSEFFEDDREVFLAEFIGAG